MKKTIQTMTLLTALVSAGVIGCGGPEDESAEPDRELTNDTLSTRSQSCWSDRDCPAGTTCEGERICPPGALCGPLPDTPGSCRVIPTGCFVDGRHYEVGEVFGGCDACTCQKDGTVACQDFVCLECWSDADCPAGFGCTLSEVMCPDGVLCRPVRRDPGYCEPSAADSTSDDAR